jgi:hypothetical protein
MVNNIVSHHTLPFRGTVMKSKGKYTSGTGMGSVLLRTGGAGSASSYIDIDDYLNTTGIKHIKGSGVHRDFGKLSSKLSQLSIEPPSNIRRQNIIM